MLSFKSSPIYSIIGEHTGGKRLIITDAVGFGVQTGSVKVLVPLISCTSNDVLNYDLLVHKLTEN